MSEKGFEPTPSIEDQNSLIVPYNETQARLLESGALDRSAILTLLSLQDGSH